MKSLYREYTNATFTKLAPRPEQWQHLGMLGPVLHAEVGDTIKGRVQEQHALAREHAPPRRLLRQGLRRRSLRRRNPAKDKTDDAVPTGATHTYVWQVPERAGPGPNDGSSIMWMYHSHTDEVADTYSGLMGPIIVTRKGMARPDGTPKDVDREFVVNFMVANENNSHWIDNNVQQYAQDPSSVNKDDDEFVESNLMHSINGYVFGNVPGLTMRKGQHVRWYLMGMGTEVDLHTPHWHGNTVLAMGMRTDVVNLLPASMVVADMIPDNPAFGCSIATSPTTSPPACSAPTPSDHESLGLYLVTYSCCGGSGAPAGRGPSVA